MSERNDDPCVGALVHAWTHLRQEERPEVVWERTVSWQIYDIYFCTQCLAYRAVHVRTEERSTTDYGRRIVTWRNA